jgi:hypothetical protein
MKIERRISILVPILAILVGCGGSGSKGDAEEDPGTDPATDMIEDAEPDVPVDPEPDVPLDVAEEDDAPADVEEDGTTGFVDDLGTNHQDITDVTRVIFLGDSITATPYFPAPWSDRIRDDLTALWGSDLEFQNYAQWGARTEDMIDAQITRIDTSSTKKTLVLFTIGGNDALQVIGSDLTATLDHMTNKYANLETIMDFLYEPTNFPGGIYVVFSDIYDPTDGEGDFTHCGFGAGLEDWPISDELAGIWTGWVLDMSVEYGADLLRLHHLFAGHGYNNTDTSNPYYCNMCEPDCPCPRWYDITCIHPNGDGHDALAGFFYDIITR